MGKISVVSLANKSKFQSVCSGTSSIKTDATTACNSTAGKCHKPGRVTRNPFLNFLRQFRQQNCGLTIVQIAVQGAQKWRSMSDEEKLPFIREACTAPKNQKSKKKRGGKVSKKSRKKC